MTDLREQAVAEILARMEALGWVSRAGTRLGQPGPGPFVRETTGIGEGVIRRALGRDGESSPSLASLDDIARAMGGHWQLAFVPD